MYGIFRYNAITTRGNGEGFKQGLPLATTLQGC